MWHILLVSQRWRGHIHTVSHLVPLYNMSALRVHTTEWQLPSNSYVSVVKECKQEYWMAYYPMINDCIDISIYFQFCCCIWPEHRVTKICSKIATYLVLALTSRFLKVWQNICSINISKSLQVLYFIVQQLLNIWLESGKNNLHISNYHFAWMKNSMLLYTIINLGCTLDYAYRVSLI